MCMQQICIDHFFRASGVMANTELTAKNFLTAFKSEHCSAFIVYLNILRYWSILVFNRICFTCNYLSVCKSQVFRLL